MSFIVKRLSAPWAIEPEWLRVAWAIGTRGKVDAAALAQAKADWDARKGKPRAEEPGAPVEGTGGTLRIVGNVAVLGVQGPLVRHADLFSDISGATSYDSLWRGLEAAEANPRVDAILLRVNSPGGEADGVNELARGLASATKPITAYIEGMGASAAYWLASQADHIVAEETAEIGSIGVRCGLLDDSAADEMAGIREIEIVSSQSPAKRGTPIDEGVIGRIQTRIDDLADVFVSAVASGRGVDAETVLSDFGAGDVMIASKAVAAGLIDEIGDFNSTLSALSAASAQPLESRAAARAPRKVNTMARTPKPAASTDEPKPAAGDEPKPGWECSTCKAKYAAEEPMHCSKCMEDHDEPDGDEEQEAAAAFGRKALALTDSADMDAAIGKIAAWKAAAAQLEQRIAAEAKATADKARADVTAAIDAAIKSKRLALGSLGNVVAMIDDEARAAALTGKIEAAAGDYDATITALGAEAWTPAEARRISAMLAAAPAVVPAAHREPPDTVENRQTVAIDEATARKYGISAEAARKYLTIDSVADLRAPKGV